MFRKFAVLLLVAVALGGCVLESKAPLFAEAQGVLVIGSSPPAMAAWNLKDGKWVRSGPDAPPLQLVAEGQHYSAAIPDKPGELMTMLFVPLAGGSYAMQVGATNEANITYVIATIQGGDILVSPLFCTDLKTAKARPTNIVYDRDSCLAVGIKDAAAFMADLARIAPAPDLKLAPLH
jgi:hypothetical protein